MQCKDLVVDSLWLQNPQQMHLIFRGCIGVIATNLLVTAPEDSPNTDGIHVVETQNIRISHCQIKTGSVLFYIYRVSHSFAIGSSWSFIHLCTHGIAGDDCISIVSGSKNVAATYITCGPGHGIRYAFISFDEFPIDCLLRKLPIWLEWNEICRAVLVAWVLEIKLSMFQT